MRRFLIPVVALALIFGVAAVGMAQVAGTPHDVQVISGEAGLEPCAMCHTPHSGSGAYPLWNRTGTTTGYTMYDSPTFDMAIAADLQAPSTNCMVCHNGLVSSLVNYPGPRSTADTDYNMTAGGELTATWTDLDQVMTDDHPVSFTYDPTVDENNNLFPAIVIGAGGTRQYIGTGVAQYPLYGATLDQFECSTCHSVHHDVAYAGPSMAGGTGPGQSNGTQVYFLRADNSGSAMCSSCHILR